MKTFFEKVTVRPFPVSRRVAARSSSRRRWRPEALIKARAVSRVSGLPEVASSSAASTPTTLGSDSGSRSSRPQAELSSRLSSVLEVLYLIFNEGYSATAGDDWVRPALCEDALRMGRVLAELMPEEPEVHGLVALMEI